MTAAAVIEQIKGLSPSERAKVIEFLHDDTITFADEAAFTQAADWTFKEHAELMRQLSA